MTTESMLRKWRTLTLSDESAEISTPPSLQISAEKPRPVGRSIPEKRPLIEEITDKNPVTEQESKHSIACREYLSNCSPSAIRCLYVTSSKPNELSVLFELPKEITSWNHQGQMDDAHHVLELIPLSSEPMLSVRFHSVGAELRVGNELHCSTAEWRGTFQFKDIRIRYSKKTRKLNLILICDSN
jgi:hypothetical protein